jgi:Flp pilus assembly protein TadG
MRIIFVTPLLWRRLDRAVRRREEGQALILVALASIAMVAVVGLAVDGGMAYLEAQKLQRAADAASLAGVIWVPNQVIIADGRGKLAANSNGYRVYKNGSDACGVAGYNSGNDKLITDSWTYNDVMRTDEPNNCNTPGNRVMFVSNVPRPNQYQVTLGVKAHRYFLGVIGLGDYYIQRTSTAEYTTQIKLGSSFNYMGSSGVLYDPSVNDVAPSANDLYARYVTNRCSQRNPPPVCVGTFWSSIIGPDGVHSNGDAYTPIYDGQRKTTAISRPMDYYINTTSRIDLNTPDSSGSPVQQYCDWKHPTQYDSWFISDNQNSPNDLLSAPGCTAGNTTTQTTPPIINQDLHGDSGGRRNFGYEIGIQIDSRALVTPSTVLSHTNVNISIYDAAFAPSDGSQLYGPGDANYQKPDQSPWGTRDFNTGAPVPDSIKASVSAGANANRGPYNGTPQLLPFYMQRFQSVPAAIGGTDNGINYSRPYTGSVTGGLNTQRIVGQCDATGAYTSGTYEYNGTSFRRCLSQYWVTDTISYGAANIPVISRTLTNGASNPTAAGGVAYQAGQPYRFNEARTRYTLYYPPQAPGIASVYANVSVPGGKVGSFEVGEMSVRYDQFPNGWPPDINLLPIEREPDQSANFYSTGPNDASIKRGQNVGKFEDGLGNSYVNHPWYNNAYCYIVSLNPPGIVDPAAVKTKNASYDPSNPASNGYDYKLMDVQPWNDTQFVYACPQGAYESQPYGSNAGPTARNFQFFQTDVKDYYWGMPFPSSQYPYNSSNTDTGKPSGSYVRNSSYSGPGAGGNPAINSPKDGTDLTNIYASDVVTKWLTATGSDLDYFPYGVRPSNSNYIDPGQECRISVGSAPDPSGNTGRGQDASNLAVAGTRVNYTVPGLYKNTNGKIDPLYQYGNPRMPFNAAYGDRINQFKYDAGSGKYVVEYYSRHGWRCSWDFDSDYDPRFNPLKPGTTEPLDPPGPSQGGNGLPSAATNNGYSWYGNGKQEPFFHLTDYTWSPSGNVVLKPGVTPVSNNAVVRPGTYMLHIQMYGGTQANRYAVKAEYENAKQVQFVSQYSCQDPPACTQRTPKTVLVTPVPNVYGITNFSIYTNAVNQNSAPADVLFDLAYIGPENAGATAVLQLFDPGDVSADSLSISLLQPAPSGNRLTNTGTVAKGDPITVSLTICPYNLTNIAACKNDPTPQTDVPMIEKDASGNVISYYNDMWVFMIFQIPPKQVFDQYLLSCNANDVPEEACYYFQVDYKLGKGVGNDQTTWQLVVQGSPVRLLK